MPFYEYDCPGCGKAFEQRLPMAQADEAVCPHCGNHHPKRHLARVNIQGKSSASSGYDVSESASSSCGCGGNCACGRHSSLN